MVKKFFLHVTLILTCKLVQYTYIVITHNTDLGSYHYIVYAEKAK